MLKMVLTFTGMCIFLRGQVVLLDRVDQSRSSVSVWITIYIFFRIRGRNTQWVYTRVDHMIKIIIKNQHNCLIKFKSYLIETDVVIYIIVAVSCVPLSELL